MVPGLKKPHMQWKQWNHLVVAFIKKFQKTSLNLNDTCFLGGLGITPVKNICVKACLIHYRETGAQADDKTLFNDLDMKFIELKDKIYLMS